MTPREKMIDLARRDGAAKARLPGPYRNPYRPETPMHPEWEREFRAGKLAAVKERVEQGEGNVSAGCRDGHARSVRHR
jgi:hypothetical protein